MNYIYINIDKSIYINRFHLHQWIFFNMNILSALRYFIHINIFYLNRYILSIWIYFMASRTALSTLIYSSTSTNSTLIDSVYIDIFVYINKFYIDIFMWIYSVYIEIFYLHQCNRIFNIMLTSTLMKFPNINVLSIRIYFIYIDILRR